MANTPNIRFKGFHDEWEQRKFEDIFKLYQGLQISLSERFTEPGINRYFYITNEFLKDTCEEVYYIESPSENVICNEEDILMTRTGNTGIVVTDVKGCFHNNFFKIKYDKDIFSKKYICYLLSTSYMQKVIMNSAGSSTIPDLSHKAFYKIVGCFPTSKEEQNKIGDNLANLDHFITLHQRKYDEMKQLKKFMLQKMFPKSGELIPEIRFAGFTGEWEQRKLEEIVERVTRKNQDLVSTLPLTISAQYGLIDQNEFFDKRVASKDVSGYYLVKKGEFAYNKSTSSDAPWGAIKRLDRYENGVLSTLYIVFAINQNVETDSDYLVTYYDTDLWHRGIREIAAEGARNHGLLNIAPADFFKTSLSVPQDIEEQKAIGKYFTELNALITLYQHKCDELQGVKKFMLQNMFV